MQKKTLLVLSALFLLASCQNSETVSSSSTISIGDISSSTSELPEDSSSSSIDNNQNSDSSFEWVDPIPDPLEAYTPTTFQKETYNETRKTIVDGVELVKITFNLNNDAAITANIVEANPTKVNIVAGTKNNSTESVDSGATLGLDKPFNQASAYTLATGKKFYAVANADFFGSSPVNAFVKDHKIIKSKHNGSLTDVPESKPMLFGINDEGKARIAPIVNGRNHEAANTDKGIAGDDSTVSAGLFYGLDIYDSENNLFRTKVVVDKKAGTEEIGLIANEWVDVQKNKIILEITKDEIGVSKFTGTVKSVEKNSSLKSIGASLTSTKAYITLPAIYEGKYNVGDKIYVGYVNSEDGSWRDYGTIIGCRHSLIENGKLASTLSAETSNGAGARVPRTAIGIKENGNVVLISIEDLHYSSNYRKEYPDAPCTGLTITQMADLLRYYGCYVAANFDGGGSSQLVVLGENGYEVVTKSSDYATYETHTITYTRNVINSIVIAEK